MTEQAPSIEDILSFNPLDPGFAADPYPHYRRLATGGLHRSAAGLLLATGHAACSEALRSPDFGHGTADASMSPYPEAPSFLLLDPPDHNRLRGLVSKAFTARRIQRLRPGIERLVDRLADGLRAAGSADLIADFAYPLPVTVICQLLGVPTEDQVRFRGWSAALARGLDPEIVLPAGTGERRHAARAELHAYFAELTERRAVEPGDDLISALVALRDSGSGLSTAELLATCTLLLVAGHETTVNLIGNGMLTLLRHPDQLATLRADPDLIAGAVEELLRYDPPVQLTGRVALADTTLAGQPIPAGQPVVLLLAAANRDPTVFADPDRLDLRREPSRHLAFGLGIHFCLGAPLARLEAEIALRALTAMPMRLRDEHPGYKENLILRGLAELPVEIG